MKYTLATVDPQAKAISIADRPVHSYTMSNDIQYIEPKARVYRSEGPVFGPEPGDPTELARIVRHDAKVSRLGLSGDQDIVRAGRIADAREIGADRGCLACVLDTVVEYGKILLQRQKYRQIAFDLNAPEGPEEEFVLTIEGMARSVLRLSFIRATAAGFSFKSAMTVLVSSR